MPGGETLVVTDVGAGLLRVYDRQGRPLRTLARPGDGPLEYNRPSQIWPLAGATLIGNSVRFLWLDEALVPVRSYDLEAVPVAPGGTVRALFEWAASEHRVYGAGDVLLPDGSWKRGLLAMDLGDATAFRFVREITSENRQEFDHYLMGYPLVTVLGGDGYFLTLSYPPAILATHEGEPVRRLRAFPPGFSSVPALPLHGGVASAEVRYQAYEHARLPVGIYGWADRIYVLTREPLPASGGGGTRWSLTRIDPGSDRIEGSVVLPSRAAHVTVIPGPDRWAVLEKGRVERYGVEPIPSMLLVPAAWIGGAASPLAAELPQEGLCGDA
jgi:hypothetical protein